MCSCAELLLFLYRDHVSLLVVDTADIGSRLPSWMELSVEDINASGGSGSGWWPVDVDTSQLPCSVTGSSTLAAGLKAARRSLGRGETQPGCALHRCIISRAIVVTRLVS